MERSKTALFIDVSNFYYSLKKQNNLPFDADKFEELVGELNNYFEVTKVNFYDAVKDRIQDPKGYAGQQRFHSRIKKLVTNARIKIRKLRYVVSISNKEIKKSAQSVGFQDNDYNKLYSFLKKLDVLKLTREKGLDILLITDALEAHKQDPNQRIIILSGDSDYVPAVEFMQKEGTKVINLHTYSGSSKELRDICSEHILLEIDNLSGKIKLKRYTK